ncbi:MAG TPA: response regulator [Candidatus Deferrimicrobium sp.]
MAPIPTPRILLVDDEKGFRFAAGVALRRGGYRVEEAADGKEALAMILSAREAGDPFGLVVTDIRMPEMSGIELIDALVAHGDRTAVCAITCFGDKTLIAELAGKGCTEYLEKPFEPARLVAWVGGQLEKRRE